MTPQDAIEHINDVRRKGGANERLSRLDCAKLADIQTLLEDPKAPPTNCRIQFGDKALRQATPEDMVAIERDITDLMRNLNGLGANFYHMVRKHRDRCSIRRDQDPAFDEWCALGRIYCAITDRDGGPFTAFPRREVGHLYREGLSVREACIRLDHEPPKQAKTITDRIEAGKSMNIAGA